MSHRFFLSQTPTEDTARLEGDEARHLARVMRAKTGDTVELFDGQGTSWTATVQAIQRNHVLLRLDQKQSETISNKPTITLAVALPKGDRQKWLIEKITECFVKGENVKLSSFGTFSVRSKKERIGRNPKTGIEARISSRRVLSFHPSISLRKRVNK